MKLETLNLAGRLDTEGTNEIMQNLVNVTVSRVIAENFKDGESND